MKVENIYYEEWYKDWYNVLKNRMIENPTDILRILKRMHPNYTFIMKYDLPYKEVDELS